MDIKFSIKGTGACPLCKKFNSCQIIRNMSTCAAKRKPEEKEQAIEVVIYRCPEFIEK